ncbi:hypothetical protein [Bartonella queenslandensis]|nr:hypothetical protein [Bartonella queenslandensis]
MGSSSSSHDSSSSSRRQSWLFPDYTDTYAQAAGTGGMMGAMVEW